MRQDVGGCSRGLTGYDQTSGEESLGESACHNRDQQKTTSQPCPRDDSFSRFTIAVAFISLAPYVRV